MTGLSRRRLLQALSAGALGSTVGCLAEPPGDTGATPTPTPTADASGTPTAETPTPVAARVDGTDLPVPRSAMRHPLPRDYIPAVVEPAFGEDWRGLDAGGRDTALPADAPVIGVEQGGRARAYPLRVLNHHEIVNDEFGGPVAITYCVLCASSVVFERRVDGEPTRFGVSGKLWRSDLVMYDDLTGSLWSQLMATAIRGPRTGERLALVPSTLTTWREWQRTHPGTRVLLPPPHSGTVDGYSRSFDYFSPEYDYGDSPQLVGHDSRDGQLHPKALVVGVESDGIARAYPFRAVADAGVVHDRVGDLPVVVAVAPDDTLVAYDRRVDGETLRFEPDGERHLAGGGTRWERSTGRGLAGPHGGRRLQRANDHPPMFWIGWSKFNPETSVFGATGG